MNAEPVRDPHGSGHHLDLARLVPAPIVAELDPGRRRLLKEQLMRQIEPSAAHPRRWILQRRILRHWRPVFAVALVVAAVTLVLSPWRTGTGVTQAAPGVVALLDRASLTAAHTAGVTVRPDQFIYVHSREAYASYGQSGYVLEPARDREIWISADGHRPGLLREYGSDQPLGTVPKPSVGNPTYEFLAGLPTDPRALLDKIYRSTRGHGTGPDAEAFNTIGDLLLETLCPPAQSAALFKAAERIPGVRVVDDATDELGRTALAVGRVDVTTGIRTEWLFDPTTYAFLGEHSVETRDLPAPTAPHAGDIVGIDVVVARGVVDRVGDIPRQTA